MDTPARLTASSLSLIMQARGTAAQRREKRRRLLYTLRNLFDRAEVNQRLQRLKDQGIIRQIPTRTQLVFGALDMFRFFIVPCADDYYQSKGISFSFHALLRFLDDPASVADPTGLMSHPDVIIGHLMQVVHADPIYDLELLSAIDGGLDALERQLEQMLAGTHPRGSSIRAIVEEPDYHARLLQYTRDFRADPARAERMRRQNLTEDSPFHAAGMAFGSMGPAMDYFCQMPTQLRWGLWRLLAVGDFPGADGGRDLLRAARQQQQERVARRRAALAAARDALAARREERFVRRQAQLELLVAGRAERVARRQERLEAFVATRPDRVARRQARRQERREWLRTWIAA